MKFKELSKNQLEQVNTLKDEIKHQLDSSSTSHLEAISQSLMRPQDFINLTMQGGKIRVASRPLLKYKKGLIAKLHREILKSEKGCITSIIINAKRLNIHTPWSLETKLLSKSEYNQIAEDRVLIEHQIKKELQTIENNSTWSRLSFGKNSLNPIPTVVVAQGKETLKKAPSDLLNELLLQTESLYQQYDLNLIAAYWTISEDQEIRFLEYFE